MTPAQYVSDLRNYRSFVRDAMAGATADPSHVSALRDAAARLPQPVTATLMTEDWCGDSACNLPILASLLDGAGIELRILRGCESPDLKSYIESDGSAHPATDHIPVLSIWDGAFREVVRWVEAPKAVSEKKDAWKAARPEFMELYRRKGQDRDAAKQFAVMYRELLNEMLSWYRSGMWSETTREIVEAAAAV